MNCRTKGILSRSCACFPILWAKPQKRVDEGEFNLVLTSPENPRQLVSNRPQRTNVKCVGKRISCSTVYVHVPRAKSFVGWKQASCVSLGSHSRAELLCLNVVADGIIVSSSTRTGSAPRSDLRTTTSRCLTVVSRTSPPSTTRLWTTPTHRVQCSTQPQSIRKPEKESNMSSTFAWNCVRRDAVVDFVILVSLGVGSDSEPCPGMQ